MTSEDVLFDGDQSTRMAAVSRFLPLALESALPPPPARFGAGTCSATRSRAREYSTPEAAHVTHAYRSLRTADGALEQWGQHGGQHPAPVDARSDVWIEPQNAVNFSGIKRARAHTRER